jgi:hypothetical protein
MALGGIIWLNYAKTKKGSNLLPFLVIIKSGLP